MVELILTFNLIIIWGYDSFYLEWWGIGCFI